MRTPLILRTLCAAILVASVPQTAGAYWGFNASLYQKDCPATAVVPPLPAIVGFPDSSTCNSTRSQVLSIGSSFGWPDGNGGSHYCQVGYNCTACSGTDVSFASPMGSGSASVTANAAGYTPALAPLQNLATSVNILATDTGQPTFSPHYSENSVLWQKESQTRIQSFPSITSGAAMPVSSLRYENRFASLVGSTITTTSPRYSQPDEPQRYSDDPSLTGQVLPMIGTDSKGQPIGGAGVTQGAPDTPPPPTPVRINPNEGCPKSLPWYNTATQQCYVGQTNCQGDHSAGPHRCYVR